MLKAIRRTLAATITALASHGFSQSAPPTTESAQVMTDAEAALREIEYDCVSHSVRPELLRAYKGSVTQLTPEMIALDVAARHGVARRDANGRLLSAGGLWRNSSVAGSAEFDEFVRTRTRDDGP